MTVMIGVVSQKGGVGKSTISRLVAREYAAAGWTVKIADSGHLPGHQHRLEAAPRAERLAARNRRRAVPHRRTGYQGRISLRPHGVRRPATFEFKRDFKIAAATQGITQSELLQQAFTEWRQRHG